MTEKPLLGMTKKYVVVELQGKLGNLSPEERERQVRYEAYQVGLNLKQNVSGETT